MRLIRLEVFVALALSPSTQTKAEEEKLVAPYRLVTSNSTDIYDGTFKQPHILVTRDWVDKYKIKKDTYDVKFLGPVLRVGCFHFPPFTFRTEQDNGNFDYSGVEVSLVTEIAGSLGLTPEFHTPQDGKFWGAIFENGTGNGLFGDILKGVVDVGMAEYFYYPRRIAISHPSDFYTIEHFCFTRMKPAPVPRWQAVLRPFTVEVWAAIFVSVLVTVFYLVFSTSFKGTLTMSKGEMVLSSLAFYIGQSLDWRKDRYFFSLYTFYIEKMLFFIKVESKWLKNILCHCGPFGRNNIHII